MATFCCGPRRDVRSYLLASSKRGGKAERGLPVTSRRLPTPQQIEQNRARSRCQSSTDSRQKVCCYSLASARFDGAIRT